MRPRYGDQSRRPNQPTAVLGNSFISTSLIRMASSDGRTRARGRRAGGLAEASHHQDGGIILTPRTLGTSAIIRRCSVSRTGAPLAFSAPLAFAPLLCLVKVLPERPACIQRSARMLHVGPQGLLQLSFGVGEGQAAIAAGRDPPLWLSGFIM